jgi:transcriptional regulator with XRE-family HTH domain
MAASKTVSQGIRTRQGNRIKEFRKVRQMSQRDLAARVGVTKQAVCIWERGHASPRAAHQAAIARALEAPWTVLFGLDAEAVA